MRSPVVARLAWGLLTTPLALLCVLVSLGTWPLVLNNSALRLGLIGYIVLLPLLPTIWEPSRWRAVALVAALTLTLQVVALGFINFWF